MIAVNQRLREQRRQSRRFILAKVGECLYRSECGSYFAVVKHLGRQHRRSLQTKDRGIAGKKLGEFRQKLNGLAPAADHAALTFEEIARGWLAAISVHLKESTHSRRVDMVRYVARSFRGKAASKISRLDCEHWATRRCKQVRSRTFNSELETMKLVFNYAIEHGLTNQWIVHVQPARTPPQRHGGERESEETSISGVSLRSPPDIKETSTGRDVRARTVPSDRTNGSFGDNSQAEPNICPNFLVGSASARLSNSAPRFENEASLNPQQFLEVVEYACQQAASRNGVRCYPRSRIDPAIADCLSGKLYKRGMHFGDVYMALAEYFSQSPSQDRGFYTLTQFELWLETKIPGLRNKNLPEPEDSNLFENSPDAEWDTPRDQWKNWTVEKVNGKTVRLPKVEVLKRYKSNLFEVYLEGGTEKVRRKNKDSEGILALTRPLCGHD